MSFSFASWTFLALRRFINYVLSVLYGEDKLMTSFGECDNEANSRGERPSPHETMGGNNSPLDNILSRASLPHIIQLASSKTLEPQEIKRYVENNPDCINAVAQRGKDTVLHRIIDRINEKCPKVSEEHKEILKFLLEKHAKVNSKNGSGETPLHVAARKNKYKTMQLLIHGCYEVKHTVLNVKNNEGQTCLHVAVHNAAVEVVAILHRYKSYFDEEKENGGGFTAKDIASKIRYNDNKEAMEKIKKILSSDLEKYESEKEYLNYLEEGSKDDLLWSLRPMTVFNTTVHEGGSATILNNSTINCNSLDDIDSLGNIDMDSPDEQDTQ